MVKPSVSSSRKAKRDVPSATAAPLAATTARRAKYQTSSVTESKCDAATVAHGITVLHASTLHDAKLFAALRVLRQRLKILAKLQLPCIVNVAHGALEQWHHGYLESVVVSAGRLNISGENFSLYLRESTIGSIVVADNPELGDIGPVVELYSRSRGLLLRIHSSPGPQSNARWREIMDEPLAGLESAPA